VAFLAKAKELAVEARRSLHQYIDAGNEAKLETFFNIALQPGVTSISHSFLFTVFDHDGYDPQDAPAERLIHLYSFHPIMDKRYYGRLLHFKFISGSILTARDVLTGIFQKFSAVPMEPTVSAITAKRILDFDKLISCRDWAEMRLLDWLAPQHLDIFVPELSLAVEYMGQQHYEPIEHFGGRAGFKGTIERDSRKLEICHKIGIMLEYVRYDEDMGMRVAEIMKRYAKQRSLKSSNG
jgi:hypothetical protein